MRSLLILVTVICFQAISGELHDAVEMEDYERLKELCNSNEWLAETNYEGFTALHLSVMAHDYTATDILLSAGSNVHHLTPDGYAAIHLAAIHAAENLIVLLVAHGANVNQHASNLNMETPLHLASSCGVWSQLIANGAVYDFNSHWEVPQLEGIQLDVGI